MVKVKMRASKRVRLSVRVKVRASVRMRMMERLRVKVSVRMGKCDIEGESEDKYDSEGEVDVVVKVG